MKRLISRFAKLLTGEDQSLTVNFKQLTVRDLIRMESKIGAQLFGPVPKGHRREFFCLDERTWIWHEEWVDPQTKRKQVITTRYEIRNNGVLKIQDNTVEGEELKNLITAIQLYYEQVVRSIYHYDPITGHPLPTHPAIINK